MNKIAFLVVAAGLAVVSQQQMAFAQQSTPAQGEKKVVRTADDLPTHEYEFEQKPSEFLDAGEPMFMAFAKQVKANIENDLATLDIQDKTTLRDRHSLLAQIAVLEGNDAAVRTHLEAARQNELKEANRLMIGHVPESMLAGKQAAGEMKLSDPANAIPG